MRNKKGFTLVELLAIIVILAIIAVITVPIVSKIIDESRRKAAKQSAQNYLYAVENYIVMNELDSTKYPNSLKNGTWNLTKETVVGSKTTPSLNSFIKMKGSKPTGDEDFVKINEKGKISAGEGNAAEMVINGYKVECQSSSKCEAKSRVKEEKIDASQVGITYEGSETSLEAALDDLNEKVGS